MAECFPGNLKLDCLQRRIRSLFGAEIKNLNRLNSSRTEESKRKQFLTILIFL